MLSAAEYFLTGGLTMPRIITQHATQTAVGGNPFTFNFTPAAGSDAIVVFVGIGRNQPRSFNTATFAGKTMVTAVASNDNDSGDTAGAVACVLTKASYIAQGGSEGNWSTSQQFSIACAEGAPDSWHGVAFSLADVNQTTPVPAGKTAHSESDGVAAKSVAIDTSSLDDATLGFMMRVIARSATVTFTPSGSITELVDTGATSESIFIGKLDPAPPANNTYGCTASSAAFLGDALIAFVLQGA